MWAQRLIDCNDPADYAYCTCVAYSCGYSQPNRKHISVAWLESGTAETDCSAGVSWWLYMGGFLDENSWFHTAIERNYLREHGFVCFAFGSVELRRNDVLLRVAKPNVLGHTALYIGEGYQAEAIRDENHQAGYEGTTPGDQDGGETVVRHVTSDWDYILRRYDIPRYKELMDMTFLFTCGGRHSGKVWFYDGGNCVHVSVDEKEAVMKAYKKVNGKDIPFIHLEGGSSIVDMCTRM